MTTVAAPRFAQTVGSRGWIVSLASLTGVTALSIDMSLPAQPTLAAAFGVTADAVQLTLSLFLLGFAIAQLVVGPLSDALGRRRILLGGLLLFAAAGLACSLTTSLAALLACRFLQGMGAAAAPVIARAMVRDTQPAASAARLLSSMVAVLAIAPMVAPMIGGALLVAAGWRAIFAALAAIGIAFAAMVALTLAETLPDARRLPASTAALAAGFVRFLRTPGTRAPAALGCAAFAGQFAWISASPFVLIQGYGVPAARYGFLFAATAVALMIGSAAGSRLLHRGWTPVRMVALGTKTLFAGGVLALVGTHVPIGAAGLMVPLLVYFAGLGLTTPSATAMALEPAPDIAGTASAAVGFGSMVSGAVSGWVITRVGGSDAHTLGWFLAAMASACAGIVLASGMARRRT